MQYLKINSADRLNPTTTTPALFTINANQPITGLRLKDIYLPATAFNVASTNNTIYFTDTAPRIAVITPGYYTNATLFTAISAAMTVASGVSTYTAQIISLTQNLLVSSTGTFQFTFSQTTNSMAEILGFSAVDTGVSTAQSGFSPLNLSTTLCYNIDINHSIGTITTTTTSTSFVIPALQASVPSEFYFQVPLQMPQGIEFQATKTLVIGIYDDQHRILNLTSNWYMTCEATYN